jgi:hypothetical protein
MLKTGTEWQDLGPDFFHRVTNSEREVNRLVAKLKALGLEVALTPAAA